MKKFLYFYILLLLCITSCAKNSNIQLEIPQSFNVIKFNEIDNDNVMPLVISGFAPPNALVTIINITFAGTEIASGYTDKNGEFVFSIDDDLHGCRLGLVIDTSIDTTKYFAGPNAMNVPQIGYFWDTLIIQ